MQHLKQRVLPITITLFLVPLFAFALELDGEYAVSLSWQFNAVMVGLALMLALPGLLSAYRKQTALLLLLFTLALLVLPFITLRPAKAFLQFHRQIRTGITIGEVQHLLAAHYPENGKFPRPVSRWKNPSSLQIMMDSTHDRVDSVFIHFQNGRVVKSRHTGD